MRRRSPMGGAYPAVEFTVSPLAAGPDETLTLGSHRPHPRLDRVADITGRIPRRLAAVVTTAALAGLVLFQVLQTPTPHTPLSSSPLLPAACRAGACQAEFAGASNWAEVERALPSGYSIDGQRIRDPGGVVQQVQILASDGVRVLTIRAARADQVPTSWASPLAQTRREAFEWTVTRTAITVQRTHAHWLMELRTGGPAGSADLIRAVEQLGHDQALVAA